MSSFRIFEEKVKEYEEKGYKLTHWLNGMSDEEWQKWKANCPDYYEVEPVCCLRLIICDKKKEMIAVDSSG